MKQPVKEIQAFINYDETSINDSDDLISFKISCDSGLCKTAMRKLEAQYLGNHNLLGKWVRVGFGVRLPDGDFDLIDYGSFLVTELTETKDTETTSIVAYDKMINAMTPYIALDIEYPINSYDYTKLLCASCGLELNNKCFGLNLVNQVQWVNGVSVSAENDIYTVQRGTNMYGGIFIDLENKINTGKKYVLSYKFKKLSGTLVSVGGHNLAFNHSDFFVDDKSTNTGYYNGYNMTDDNEIHKVDVYFTAKDLTDITDFELYIQINRNSNVDISYQVWDIMLSETEEKQIYTPYNDMNNWEIAE